MLRMIHQAALPTGRLDGLGGHEPGAGPGGDRVDVLGERPGSGACSCSRPRSGVAGAIATGTSAARPSSSRNRPTRSAPGPRTEG